MNIPILLAMTPEGQSTTFTIVKTTLLVILIIRIGSAMVRYHKIEKINDRIDRINEFFDATE